MRIALIATLLVSCAHPQRRGASVLTLNARYDAPAIEPAIEMLSRERPDVVCLQEVTQRLVDRFPDDALPHRRFEARTGTWGIGVASRWPLSEVAVFEQQPHRMPAIDTVIDAPSGEIRVVCVHLFPPGAKRDRTASLIANVRANAMLREQQAQSIIDRLRNETRPVVLLGDFNEGPGGKAMRAFTAAGFVRAPTGPTWHGVARVDHVLLRGIAPAEARVIGGTGSDHAAVAVGLTVP